MSSNGIERDPFELRDLATEAGKRLEDATAHQIIEWAVGEFGERFCVTSSMADAAVVHLASEVAPGIDVVFLDTGLHFPETLEVRDFVASTMNVNVRSIQPDQSVLSQDAEFGPRLFNRAPDECCSLRKVLPLNQALADYDGWATGLRRDEGPTRANTRVVDFDLARRKVKVSPIAKWTEADQEAYIERYNIPVNPLLKDGFRSIGCWPCTRRTEPGEDPRAGRWAAFDKTECGLHV
ncbi:phosphoadenylyl-sulfate reductase [Glycomyces dulcitolivorans]|jgi:phosphoadenosine phosphosulfate reductase|uniref:phosphoadenylyl-sulfate reductase n=1 Tax=Glycomyces dulcitolivorans TaxID=2200759 RepID=UPI000DD48B35|nr:phosphoadenylyl-sulfate reductase [Glycomyces dulcitolivorans]